MKRFFQWFFSPTKKEESSSFYLADKIIELQKRIEELESENKELQELILETETNLQTQIDRIHPVIYHYHDKTKSAKEKLY